MPITRPQFTVRTTDGRNFDANILVIGSDKRVTFFCSGTVEIIDVAEIASIDFGKDGATWCPHCDQPLVTEIKSPDGG